MKSGLLLLILIFNIYLVNAELEFSHDAFKDKILVNQEGLIFLTVKNLDSSDTVNLRSDEEFFRVKFEQSLFALNQNEEKTVKTIIKPLKTTQPGNYIIEITAFSATSAEVLGEHPFSIIVIDPKELIITQLLTRDIDPRKEGILKVNFQNNYDVELENIEINLKSDLFDIKRTINLNKFEEKTEDFKFEVDEKTKEGTYDLDISLTLDNELLDVDKEKLNVVTISDVQKTTDEIEGLITKTFVVTIKNEGNSLVKESFTQELSFFRKIFTKTNPEPDSIEKVDGNYVLTWNFDLNPGEGFTVKVMTGFRALILAALIILLLALLWLYFLSKEVSITKKVITISKSEEGLSRLKIMLSVKNTSNRTINNPRILERLPLLVHPAKDSYTGVKPRAIKKTGRGIAVVWHIEKLEPGEELIATYIAESKLAIIGKQMLPSAMVKYRNKRGRIVRSISNKLIFFSIPDFGEFAD